MLARPKRPTRPTSSQYGQPAQGSPVDEEGTVVGVMTVVVDEVVVEVVVVDVVVVEVVVVDVVVVVVVGGGDVLQVGTVMVLSSRLTWPFRAKTRPSTVVPVCTDADVNAKMLPTNVVLVPKVAELPTCQNTLHA
jgi:hypothetical protein